MTNEWHRHPSERDASQCDPLITVPPRAATARVNQSAAGAETPTQSAAVALPSGSCRYSCRCRGQRCCFARWAPASTAPASHPATAASLGWQAPPLRGGEPRWETLGALEARVTVVGCLREPQTAEAAAIRLWTRRRLRTRRRVRTRRRLGRLRVRLPRQ